MTDPQADQIPEADGESDARLVDEPTQPVQAGQTPQAVADSDASLLDEPMQPVKIEQADCESDAVLVADWQPTRQDSALVESSQN